MTDCRRKEALLRNPPAGSLSLQTMEKKVVVYKLPIYAKITVQIEQNIEQLQELFKIQLLLTAFYKYLSEPMVTNAFDHHLLTPYGGGVG